MSGKSNSKTLIFTILAFVAGVVLLSLFLFAPLGFVASYLFTPPFTLAQSTLSESMLKDLPPLEIGDVILREGVGSDSAVIKQVSGHRYSHVGLVVNAKPTLILHATTDDNKRAQNQVILSSFGEFLSQARAIAIKRYELSPAAKEAIALSAMSWEGRAFVLRARDSENLGRVANQAREKAQILSALESSPAKASESSVLKSQRSSASESTTSESDELILYCTTLLEQILSPYTELSVPYEFMNVPGFRGEYLYPKAFYEDSHSRLIYEFSL